jgi:S1-C subfamily serine protease
MTQAQATLSDLAAAAVEAAGRHVVRVDARRRSGSGIIWSADGLVVTADHIIHREDGITVGVPAGDTVPAVLVGRDPATDVALLRVEAAGLGVPVWRDLDGAKVGHVVLALGRPGRTVRAALGILSAIGGAWRTQGGASIEHYVETDARALAGFSGGPLVDTAGRVLGLYTAGLVRGATLAVPLGTLRPVVDALRAHGRIRRAYLGVATHAAALPAALRDQVGQRTGLLVFSVEPDGPAGRAGMVLGDTIVALDGHPVRRVDDLWGLLDEGRIGATVTVRIVRAGQIQDLAVVPAERRGARAA